MKKRIISLLLTLVMLAGLLPAGAFTLSAAAAQVDAAAVGGEEYDYTDPSDPYIATDFEGLRNVFNKKRSGETVYIRLGKDIIFRDNSGKPEALSTNGTNVVLDLGGYTLSYTAMKTNAMYGYKGKITVKDSQRYEASSGKWISGKVEYDYQVASSWSTSYYVWYSSTSVMIGDIAVYGGTFINHNSLTNDSQDSVYCGETLEMYGGVFEAEYPLNLTDSYRTDNNVKKVLIDGGTLRAKGQAVVLDEFHTDGKEFVTIKNCEMINAGSDRAMAYYVDVSDKVEYDTANDLFDRFFKRYPEGTAVFIDEKLQSSVRSGMIFDGDSKVLGPAFDSTFYVKNLGYIDELDLAVKAPEAGDYVSYAATPQGGAHYVINMSYSDSTWKNGVMWGTGSEALKIADNNKFIGGNRYTVTVAVGLTDKFAYRLADKDSLTATVNGRKATVIWISDMSCMVQCSFDVEIQEIGSVSVTVPEMEAGERITYSATTPFSTGYMVENFSSGTVWKTGVKWEQLKATFVTLSTAETNYFQGAATYRLSISLEPTNTEKYRFGEAKDMTATINGDAAEISNNTDGTVTLTCIFRVREALDSFDLKIRTPSEGDYPRYTATINGSTYHYSVEDYTGMDSWKNGVMWIRGELGTQGFEALDPAEENVFEPGEKYTVCFMLTINRTDSYKFADADKCTAAVNGNAATVYRISENEMGVYYTFTIPGRQVIRSVAINIEEPTAGAPLPYYATVPSGMGYYLNLRSNNTWQNGVMWLDENGEYIYVDNNNVFEAGKEYTVLFDLYLTDKDNSAFGDIDNMTAAVSGHPAKLEANPDHSLSVSCTFTVEGAKVVDKLEVTVTEPKAGAARSYAATVPAGKGYAVEDFDVGNWKDGVCWKDQGGYFIKPGDTGVFEAGKEYTVCVSLALTDSDKYTFAAKSEDFTATLNGKKAEVELYNDGTCGVVYTFTVPAAGGYIVGDVNSDDEVNNRDAMILDRYIAEWKGYDAYIKNMDAADMDRKGTVDNRDAMILDRVVAGWPGYYEKYCITVTG